MANDSRVTHSSRLIPYDSVILQVRLLIFKNAEYNVLPLAENSVAHCNGSSARIARLREVMCDVPEDLALG